MIPIRDKIPSSSFPVVNTALIVLNVLVFFYEVGLGRETQEFIYNWGLIPAELGRAGLFGQIYPFFTSMFLHGGWLHVIFNMLYLYIFGDNVEDRMGHFKYLVFYLLAGLCAALAQVLINPSSSVPMVGASGAIAGVLGAYFVYFPKSRILTLLPVFYFIQLVEIPALAFLLIWFIIQFLSGVTSMLVSTQEVGGVAWWAHIGGFAAGFILAKPFSKRFLKAF